jgi:flagellar protein FliJ
MFHFNLQPLLLHREFLEKVRKKELAEVERSLGKEKQALEACRNREAQILCEIESQRLRKSTISELRIYSLSHARLAKEVEKQHKVVRDTEQLSHEKRNDLLEAMKNRKALDRLKENKWREYCRKEARNEQAFISEVAVQQFNRKSRP